MFPVQIPRRFSFREIELVPRGAIGCYGLLRADAWVYVGKGNIRDQLLGHLDGKTPWITVHRPTHWMFVVTTLIDEMERQLVAEYRPICNTTEL